MMYVILYFPLMLFYVCFIYAILFGFIYNESKGGIHKEIDHSHQHPSSNGYYFLAIRLSLNLLNVQVEICESKEDAIQTWG